MKKREIGLFCIIMCALSLMLLGETTNNCTDEYRPCYLTTNNENIAPEINCNTDMLVIDTNVCYNILIEVETPQYLIIGDGIIKIHCDTGEVEIAAGYDLSEASLEF